MLSAFFPWKGNRIPTFGGAPKAVSLTRLGVTPLARLTKPQYLLLGKFRFEKQEPTVLLKYKAKLGRKQQSLRVCEQWGCWPLSPSKLSVKHKLAPGVQSAETRGEFPFHAQSQGRVSSSCLGQQEGLWPFQTHWILTGAASSTPLRQWTSSSFPPSQGLVSNNLTPHPRSALGGVEPGL